MSIANPFQTALEPCNKIRVFKKKSKKYPKMIGEKTGAGNTCGMVSYTLLQR